MIGIEEARRLIDERTFKCAPQQIPIDRAHGKVLDEDIVSTVDSPPHDKSQVDGFAVRCDDLVNLGPHLRVIEEVTAGEVPKLALTAGQATRIMTGAPIPDGADAVVMVERTEYQPARENEPAVVFIGEMPRLGQNVMRRGTSMRSGDAVLRRGHRVRAIEIGLLAELGISEVFTRAPSAAVISTGNELVEAEQLPGPGQIRNSNGPMLTALLEEAGANAVNLGIARDTEAELMAAIRKGLEYDLLLLSGGVSAGVLDLVPNVLRQLGVREVFHKVRLKPGKPLWFGTAESTGVPKLVFGLPGNPVSGLVCFKLFVQPALCKMAGKPTVPRLETAELTVPFRHHGDRPTYFPGRTQVAKGGKEFFVEPLGWRGSADLRTLVDADVLICFESGDYELPVGAAVEIMWL